MSAPALRAPQSTAHAKRLLEEYVRLSAKLAAVEAQRNAAIAAANQTADAHAGPLLDSLGKIEALLEPWWSKAAPELTQGKRKSVQLGGCKIGTKAGRPRLVFAKGDDDAAATLLRKHKWAAPRRPASPTA